MSSATPKHIPFVSIARELAERAAARGIDLEEYFLRIKEIRIDTGLSPELIEIGKRLQTATDVIEFERMLASNWRPHLG